MEFSEHITDKSLNFKSDLFKAQKSDCGGNGKEGFPQMSNPFPLDLQWNYYYT